MAGIGPQGLGQMGADQQYGNYSGQSHGNGGDVLTAMLLDKTGAANWLNTKLPAGWKMVGGVPTKIPSSVQPAGAVAPAPQTPVVPSPVPSQNSPDIDPRAAKTLGITSSADPATMQPATSGIAPYNTAFA